MRTAVQLLAFVCMCSNALLFAEWFIRGEHTLAAIAAFLVILSAGLFVTAPRLRRF